jgi:hypothetical protein
MFGTQQRYFAFVSRFVDAVVTQPVSQELMRLRRDRVREAVVIPMAVETRKAA